MEAPRSRREKTRVARLLGGTERSTGDGGRERDRTLTWLVHVRSSVPIGPTVASTIAHEHCTTLLNHHLISSATNLSRARFPAPGTNLSFSLSLRSNAANAMDRVRSDVNRTVNNNTTVFEGGGGGGVIPRVPEYEGGTPFAPFAKKKKGRTRAESERVIAPFVGPADVDDTTTSTTTTLSPSGNRGPSLSQASETTLGSGREVLRGGDDLARAIRADFEAAGRKRRRR